MYTQQNNLRVTKCNFSYMQTLTESMGKTTEDIEILKYCWMFLKVEPENECIQQQILKWKFSFYNS